LLSAGAPSRGGILRTGVIRHFDTAGYTGHQAGKRADAFAVVGADARVEHMGARPNRAVVVKTALTCVTSPTVVRFWNLVESGSTTLW
jgi:hypothetical protein